MNYLKRLYTYQSERFPLLAHGLLIASFTFSAAAYSRLCRGMHDFIGWQVFLPGIFITLTLFLLVRIFDEHKDAEDDAKYRPELPVPRGLVSLNELKTIGVIVFGLQIAVLWIWLPDMFPIFFVVIAYLSLMGKEFFIAEWLKKHQFWYVVSHMFIIPLVDVFASGLDWLVGGLTPPLGLLFFFAVSYFNGIVLEIGRKIKSPEQESEGVLSYTAQLGTRRAVWTWVGILLATLGLAIAASVFAGLGVGTIIFLLIVFFLCLGIAWRFLQQYSPSRAKAIEIASGFWTLSMYLSLGGIPMLKALFS
ncbi:MAG: UbiA family prenyltransferase [Saprospiraceae bacterium]|nr:UbiA family prenyltransferase [Saprospiraceae bacterium]